MSAAVTSEANRILGNLAAMPGGIATAQSRAIVREIMLQTGGAMMACGSLYDIKSRSLGGGVYRITLVPALG